MKVYCWECKYYYEGGRYYGEGCLYSDNLKRVDNWNETRWEYIREVKSINKNNDCSWYKRKSWFARTFGL